MKTCNWQCKITIILISISLSGLLMITVVAQTMVSDFQIGYENGRLNNVITTNHQNIKKNKNKIKELNRAISEIQQENIVLSHHIEYAKCKLQYLSFRVILDGGDTICETIGFDKTEVEKRLNLIGGEKIKKIDIIKEENKDTEVGK